MLDKEFDTIWSRIEKHSKEPFVDSKGNEFSYEFNGCHVTIPRENKRIPRSEFYRAYKLMEPVGVDKVRSTLLYIYPILNDIRITEGC